MSASNPEKNNPDRRIVLHTDMNSFFASVEIREKPELKGLPVVVGADPKGGSGRRVVITCLYEARKFEIHSAIYQYLLTCPLELKGSSPDVVSCFFEVNVPLQMRIS